MAGLSLSSRWCRLLLEAATLFRFGPFASRWYEAVAVKKEFLHKDRGRRTAWFVTGSFAGDKFMGFV